jgi:type III pantothenate kinase
MLLAIDIGNTNIVLGLYDGPRLVVHWRLATQRDRTPDEYAVTVLQLFAHAGLGPDAVTAAIIASVVPPLTRPMEEMCERYFGQQALFVDAGNAGIAVRYSPAGDVGADRIVNAVAAWEMYGKSATVPLIVVDFGTGTTFDVITREGEYVGGVICPGIGISAEALFQRAARLPRVDVRKPPTVIGQNTVNAMQSGLFFGYAEMVDGLVRRIRQELAGGAEASVIATGGLAEVISGEARSIQRVEPDLTLHGLRLIWRRNQAS